MSGWRCPFGDRLSVRRPLPEVPHFRQYKQDVRGMVTTLVKRAKPSYAGEVREFAGRIGLLD